MKRKAKSRAKKVSYLPKGYSEVTPYLSIRGAASAIDFYKKAFGAKEVMRMPGPAGKFGHAEIALGASRIMLSDEYPEMSFIGPQSLGGSAVHIHVYVKDVDAMAKRAVAAGAERHPPGRGAVLRRPHRLAEGPLRARLAPRHPRQGRADGRAEEALRAKGEGNGAVEIGVRARLASPPLIRGGASFASGGLVFAAPASNPPFACGSRPP